MSFMLGITPWPVVSALLWIILITAALYLIRNTAHQTRIIFQMQLFLDSTENQFLIRIELQLSYLLGAFS